MKRSYSLSEAAKKARELRNIWSSEYQDAAPDEKNEDESTKTEHFADDKETVETKQSSDEIAVSVLAEAAKPRKAKPVYRPSATQRPGPTLRTKSRPKPIQQTTEPAAEKQPLSQPGTADSPNPADKPLERKSPPFSERYERITTYLEKPLLRRVHDLHQRGEIAKIASLLNAAVREYLDRYYPS